MKDLKWVCFLHYYFEVKYKKIILFLWFNLFFKLFFCLKNIKLMFFIVLFKIFYVLIWKIKKNI